MKFILIFLSITAMIESKANGYFYYLPQTNVQYPQVFHTYPFTYSGLQNLPEVKVQPKLVQPTQPEKKHTIVVDSDSGVVVSCIDGTCNYAKENIIPSTALLLFDLKKSIGLEPRGYPDSLLDVFHDPEVVLEYEKFEKAMDTDGNGIIGESEFNGFKDYSKTSDELFCNGHEDTWLLTLKSPKGACDELLRRKGHDQFQSSTMGKNFMWDLSTYLPNKRSFTEDRKNSFFNLATFSALLFEFNVYDTNKDGVLTFDSASKEKSGSNIWEVCSDYTWFNDDGRVASGKEFMIYKLGKLVDMLKKQ